MLDQIWLFFWRRRSLWCYAYSGPQFPHKLYYRPQTKFAKVMFLHVSVILSTWGGVVFPPGQTSPGRHPPGRHPPGQTHPPDMTNEQAVRILLECILVYLIITIVFLCTNLCLIIITVRNSSCGKVMFSQACVKNTVHRGAIGSPPLGRHPSPRADTPPDSHCSGRYASY